MSPTIPSTGRLGSLAKTIAEETNNDVLNKLFENYKTSLKGEELSNWVLKMLNNLEEMAGSEKTIKIIEQDGRKSCGKGFKNTVIRLMEKSDSIQDFVNNLQEHYKRSSFFEYVDDKTIIGGHNKCYMMIKSAKKPIDSLTFCHFCVGHGKEFYGAGLERPVDAEIIETVMTGGQTCKFKFKF
ncbi:MAG: hypothetical protein GF311_08430 [Candidatus Lokiarchaeota archaeon]|nr:hypothetical protein [Candidatus Lokiarchaeota archaeon]